MSALRLPITPDGYSLEKGFLSTFDLDENLLGELVKGCDLSKFLFVRGDGEYAPSSDANNPLKKRIVDIFFEATNKKLPNGKFQPTKYHHAKIWFFLYRGVDGSCMSKLIVQSKNIYSYDSLEVALKFTGEKSKETQNKNEPLVAYFESLLPFLDEEKKAFVQALMEEIPHHRFFLEEGNYKADDFEFIVPNCQEIPLFQEEYDEALIVAPFINVETINALLAKKKEGGRCVVLSQATIIESLIISGVQNVCYLSPNVSNRFVHAKIYLLRRGDAWDVYAGSMNLSEYSVTKNIEAMVRLKGVKGIESVEAFLSRLLGVDVSNELQQYSDGLEEKNVSPVFNDAYKINTRIRYIKKLLSNKKYEEEQMHHVSSYLLSAQSVGDLSDLANFRKEIIPTRLEIIAKGNKKRFVYQPSFEENALLGLLNFSLHQYDHLFSKNVFLHVLDRGVDGAFIKIHETEGLKDFYLFKTDIHNFDPSMDKATLCSQMDKLFPFDPHFCRFAKTIINESRYHLEGNERIYTDDIIHQTGLPLGGFFENVYLHDFDFVMEKAPLYLRCGDDILIGTKDKGDIEAFAKFTKAALTEKKLTLSEGKTLIASPGEKISYLGWRIENGEVDFTDEALEGIQKTIKKKTKGLLVMYGKSKLPNALRLPSVLRYVRHYQRSEFFTSCFKRVTVTEGLRAIDKMIMDLIRAVVSGKTGNSKYKIKYESIQAFGYKSLVNQYYEYISSKSK